MIEFSYLLSSSNLFPVSSVKVLKSVSVLVIVLVNRNVLLLVDEYIDGADVCGTYFLRTDDEDGDHHGLVDVDLNNSP